jgi:hypothetical protein
LVLGITLTVPKSTKYRYTDIYNNFTGKRENTELFHFRQGLYEFGHGGGVRRGGSEGEILQ